MLIRRNLLMAFALASLCHAADRTHWVASWSASPAPPLATAAELRAAKLEFQDQTIRQIVRSTLGGGAIRLRLSNAYGRTAASIGAVHVALRAKGSEIVPGSDRTATFSGRPSVTIPPDAPVLSDPIQLNVPAGGDLAISIYLPKATAAAGIHYAALQTSFIGKGDQTAAASLPGGDTITSWVFLGGVDVLAPQAAFAIVAIGDSITDGARSTVDENRRWPDVLASRLRAQGQKAGVVDAGIGGNRILHDASGSVRFGVSALARFERDALAQPGVRYIIVLEGINDLGHPGSSAPESETVTADDLIAGMKQMIERAHERGIKIIGGTIAPFEGTVFKGYFTPEKEQKRKAVNQWIRTGRAFDGVIDFDQAVRDPKNPDRILAEYDSGDHLHPGDAGYRAMGNAVDLKLFR